MFETRIKKLQDSLTHYELDAFLITSSYNISYLTGIFAFSNEERESRILITRQNIYLFTDARYTEMVKKGSPFVTLIEISYKNPFFKAIQKITDFESLKYLGFEEENITYLEIADLEEDLEEIEFVPLQNIVEKQREIKDANEIENIKKACHLSDLAFEFILKYLKPGVTELEIKTKLENFIRQNGGNLSFESIIAFGKNSAIPHHMSTTYKLQSNTCILLDFGAKIGGYCSDMTRTVFLGKPLKQYKDIYNSTKDAQEASIAYLKTHMNKGFKSKNAHILANKHFEESGFPQIPHSIGHGVGLQVHEAPWLSPYSDEKLEPGMIVTIEPGIYIPNLGGVRIEDTILITQNDCEILTKSPKKLLIL